MRTKLLTLSNWGFLYVYLILLITTKAQGQQHFFTSFSVNEGLSSSVVSVIYQDRQGLMWIGTDEGLNKYDGYNFTTYRRIESDTNSLPNNLIRDILEDSEGRLWVSTFNGVGYYDQKREKFHRMVGKIIGEKIFELPNKEILISGDGGIRIINTENQNITQISTSTNHGLPSNQIVDIVEDKMENVWLIFNHGIARYNYSDKKVLDHQTISNNAKGLEINSAAIDHSENIWLAADTQLMIYDPKTHIIQRTIPVDFNNSPNSINQICATSESEIWIGTQKGLFIYDIITGKITQVTKEQNRNSITNNEILDIYEDANQNLWIGTYGGGINFTSDYDNDFYHYDLRFNRSDNSGNVIVSGFAEDEKKNIYISTWGDGIKYFDPLENEHFDLQIGDSNSFQNEIFRAVVIDDDKEHIWAASKVNGLLKINKNTGVYKHYLNNERDSTSLSSNTLYTIFKTSKDEIWVGHQYGVDVYDPKTDSFRRKKDLKKFDGGELHYVRSITEDENGTLHLGTHGNGVLIYYGPDKPSTHLESGNSKLNNDIVYAMTVLDNKLFVGKMHGGLTIINLSDKKMVTITSNHGLPNDCINGMVTDKDKNLWVSTNNGVSTFSPSLFFEDSFPTQASVDAYYNSSNFTNFNLADGLQNNEFKYGAYYKNDDFIFFGGINGYNKFQLQKIIENPIIPKLVFNEVKAFTDETWEKGESPEINTEENDIPTITLNHRHNLLTIDYAALNYVRSNKNQYAYYLENFDNDWRHVGDQRKASYTNLPSGEFIFHVKASNNSGVWNEEGIKMKIKVIPPFWATVWFQFIIVFSVLSLLYLYYRYRLNTINERNKELEKAVDKRTTELKSVNNALNSKKEEIEKMWEQIHQKDMEKLEFFTNISHEFRTPLTLIAGPLHEITKQNTLKQPVKNLLSIMQQNTNRLLKLVNELLDFRAIQNHGTKLSYKEVNIVKFIKEIGNNFKFQAKVKNIDILYDLPEASILLWIDPEKLEKVIYNIIGNALKFTKNNGVIRIGIQAEIDGSEGLEFCKIEIRDNGIGISENRIENIFDRYYQDQGQMGALGTGIGLSLSKEIVKLHKGELVIMSEKGFGTTVNIRLPQGNSIVNKEEISDNNEYRLLQDYEFSVISDTSTEMNKKINPDLITKDQTVILLVEDDDELRSYMKRILSPQHIILEAENGKVAQELANQYIPDIIITDVMMPVQDGITMVQNLKNNEKTSHIPVIIVSAKANNENLIEGFKTGIIDYLIKPFNSEILLLKISNILYQRKLLQERIKAYPFEKSIARTNPEDVKFYQKVQGVIEENIGNEEFNTESLAHLLNMSRSQLYRKLSAISDASASELIKEIRMNKAKERLLHSNDSITSIAYQLGFKNTSHFTRSFSSKFGEPPSRFRASDPSKYN